MGCEMGSDETHIGVDLAAPGQRDYAVTGFWDEQRWQRQRLGHCPCDHCNPELTGNRKQRREQEREAKRSRKRHRRAP